MPDYWKGLRWLPVAASVVCLATFILALKLLTASIVTSNPSMEYAAVVTVSRPWSSSFLREYVASLTGAHSTMSPTLV